MLNRTIAPATQALENFNLPSVDVVSLPNGAKVHYLPNSMQPVIRFEIVFKAGKWFEPAPGISYLTSKLLMEGTKTKTAKDIADFLDFYGASLECNQGFDWATLTLYCLSKHINTILPLVLEILNEANFPEKEFELLKQRTTQNILVERKKPAYLAMEAFTQAIYGKNHPYVSGIEPEAINNVKLEDVKKFYSTNYNLQTSEIFICGDFIPETIAFIENSFKTVSQNLPNEVLKHESFPSVITEQISVENSIQSAIRMGKELPLINDPNYLKLTVVNKILGGYFGSRLMKNIREDKGYTYGIYSSLSVRKYSTLFFIGTEVKIAVAEDTIKEIRKEMAKLSTDEVSKDELETVQNFMIGKFISETNTVFDVADRYKHIILNDLPLNHYSQFLNTIRTITTDEIRNLSSEYFSEPMTLVSTSL